MSLALAKGVFCNARIAQKMPCITRRFRLDLTLGALKIILGFPAILLLSVTFTYVLTFFVSYLSRPRPGTFLIPQDFEGSFKVIYGEGCGLDPPIENGRRILQIPANGILIIQPGFEAGIIDHEYYFIDQEGKRTKVGPYENYPDGTKKIPGVQLGSSGIIVKAMPNDSSSPGSPLAIHYTDFKVYRDTIDRYDFKEKRKFDSLTTALVDECRKLNK